MRFDPVRRSLLAGAAGLPPAMMLSGCGSAPSEATETAKPERSNVKVGYLPIPSNAVLFLARKRGYFGQAGLTATPKLYQGGAAAVPDLLKGNVDAVYSNTVSLIQGYAQGAPLRIIAENDVASPRQSVIMVPNTSRARQLSDLKGATIGVNTRNNLGQLLVTAMLDVFGVKIKRDRIKFVEVPFPGMTQALKEGAVDAVWNTEPFVTQAESQIGARIVFDTAVGPTESIPIGAYAVTQQFVQKYPATAKAFKQAIGQAQALAEEDRKAVVDIVPSYTKIDATTASVISLGRFVTSTNPVRLKRLSDMMRGYGYIKNDVDVRKMLV